MFQFKMPDLATTGAAVRVLGWRVKPGDAVTRGQIILEVETDKATMEVESTVTGVLKEIAVHQGAEVDAGTVLALIESNESALAASVPAAVAVPVSTPAPVPQIAPAPPTSPKAPGGMFARNQAAAASASGAPAASRTAPGNARKLSPARRISAQRLLQSKQTIPHFYLQTSFNAEPMIVVRSAALPDKLAWDAFFVMALSKVLPRYDELACRFEDGQLTPLGTDTIGVAADVDGDLYVIPVETPKAKSISEISRQLRERVTAIRKGEAGARSMKPAAISVTNLGSANVETFIPIINPPEAAILAVGKIRAVVVPNGSDGFVLQNRANLTLAVDHRVTNGRYAADFLGAIVEELEKL